MTRTSAARQALVRRPSVGSRRLSNEESEDSVRVPRFDELMPGRLAERLEVPRRERVRRHDFDGVARVHVSHRAASLEHRQRAVEPLGIEHTVTQRSTTAPSEGGIIVASCDPGNERRRRFDQNR